MSPPSKRKAENSSSDDDEEDNELYLELEEEREKTKKLEEENANLKNRIEALERKIDMMNRTMNDLNNSIQILTLKLTEKETTSAPEETRSQSSSDEEESGSEMSVEEDQIEKSNKETPECTQRTPDNGENEDQSIENQSMELQMQNQEETENEIPFNKPLSRRQRRNLRDKKAAEKGEAEMKKIEAEKQKREERVPVITLESSKGWPTIHQRLRIAGYAFEVQSRRTAMGGLILIPKTAAEHRAITGFLTTHGVKYFTNRLPADKPAKVVLKNVPEGYTPEEIRQDLVEQGLNPTKIQRLHSRGPTKKELSVVFVELPKEQEEDFMKIEDIDGSKVKVERLKNKEVLQCYRCQNFHHAQGTCYMTERCVICAGPHRAYQCNIKGVKEAKATCANCGGEHPASYRGCPKVPKIKTTRPTTQPGISRPAPQKSQRNARTTYASTVNSTAINSEAGGSPLNEMAQWMQQFQQTIESLKPMMATFQSMVQLFQNK